MEQTIFTIIVSGFVGYLSSMAIAKFNRRNTQEDKDEAREEEITKEKIISDRMIAERMLERVEKTAERMMEKVDKQEILIGELRERDAAKDAKIAVQDIRIEFLQDENKRLRGEHLNVE